MPTLQFKGKNIVWNHHLSIPYHSLDAVPKLDFQSDKGEGNLIIEGDNLLALKALLPQYSGKIKCIYIDPPYNTGNEGWVYNDRVNSPLIKEWLGKEVGKDDMTKHDKWLCMATPRLKILRELLKDDGIFFSSIDENEVHHYRQLLDEIFGETNFIAMLGWQKVYGPKNQSTYFSNDYEFVLCYAKDIANAEINLLPRTEEMNQRYKNPDNDSRGPWKPGDLVANEERKGGHYIIKSPASGKSFDAPQGKHWAYSEDNMKQLLADNRIWFGKDGKSFPSSKQFLSEVKEGRKASSLLVYKEYGHTDMALKEIKNIFDDYEKVPFSTPKPTKLIKNLMLLGAGKNVLVLDSFAGSGTTMHAVMDLNKEDGGNRKCIMVQMTEATEQEPKKNVCKDVTRERVKRAIEKHGYKSGFKYLRVGDPIDAEAMLAGTLPAYKQFAKYVYYLCTGEYLQDESSVVEKSYFVGMHKKEAIYLIYKKDYDTLTRLALNLDTAERMIKEQKGKKIICYAPACFLDEEYLEANNIEFVGIPYNLFRRNGQ